MIRLFGTPALFPNEDRRLELFVVGFDGGLYQRWQEKPNGAWSGWNYAGSANYQPPGLISSLDQRLELFVGGGGLEHKWQEAINNGWSTWFGHGAPPAANPVVSPSIGAPTTAFCRRDDGVYVFATDISTGSGLWYIHQTSPNNGFSDWISLGNPSTTFIVGPSGVGYNDGLIQVFAVGKDNALWSIEQKQIPQPHRHFEWSDWSSYGIAGDGFDDRPAIKAGAEGRNELFVIGRDGSLYHIWQPDLLGGWSPWYSHGNPGARLKDHPELVYPQDARLIVFASGSDGAVH